MDYRLTGPISTYPNGYHKDPFFGDPSPGLDQRWIDRLRRKRVSAFNTLMLTALKMPRYASPQRNSRTTTRAVSFWGTNRDISLPQQRITTCTASGSSTRLFTRITTSPTTRRRSSSAETLTPVLIPPLETASLQADNVSRALPTQLVPLANVQRGYDYPRYEVASEWTPAVTSRPRARVHGLGSHRRVGEGAVRRYGDTRAAGASDQR